MLYSCQGKKRVFERGYHYSKSGHGVCLKVRDSVLGVLLGRNRFCLESRILGPTCLYLLATSTWLRDEMSFGGNFLPLFYVLISRWSTRLQTSFLPPLHSPSVREFLSRANELLFTLGLGERQTKVLPLHFLQLRRLRDCF